MSAPIETAFPGVPTAKTTTTREARDDRDELESILGAMVFQKRLVDFASRLEGVDKVLFVEHMLASSPLSLGDLGKRLGLDPQQADERLQDLSERLRNAVAGVRALQSEAA